ncbi:MAG: FtsX-like permease family protein [Spirochaetes bacterium]|nr:FtsX-like permease family protein [Spirochaetota bacterium]
MKSETAGGPASGRAFLTHTALLFKIAWRNIWLHRGKSLIIGIILLTGTVVMTVGNATITGMDKGLQKTLVDGLLGDLMVIAQSTDEAWALLGNMGKSADLIPDFEKVRDVVTNDPGIMKFLPMDFGMFMAVIQADSASGQPPFVVPLGVQYERYLEMFSNVAIVKGRGLRPGESGILLHHTTADRLFKTYGSIFSPVDDPYAFTNYLPPEAGSNLASVIISTDLIIVGISDKKATLDIRVPIIGIYSNQRIEFGGQGFDLIDIQSYRQGMNYTLGDEEVKLSASENAMLNMDENALFASFSENVSGAGAVLGDVKSLMVKKPAVKAVDYDRGGTEILALRLKDRRQAEEVRGRLTKAFKEKNLKAKVIDWRKAAGTLANMASVIRIALFVFVGFVFFVAGIVIVNTLAMATMERSSELGMMRAVGAQRGFLGEMLLTETFLLAVFFGGIGMVVGAVIVKILAAAQIQSTPGLLVLVFGGNVFNPLMGLKDFVQGGILLTLVTLLSVIYPARLAQSITPLDAVSRD